MRKHGYTLIELVLVLFLLVLVAFFVFSVTGIGSQAFLRLNSWQERTTDLRIGLSYIDVKVHSYDQVNALTIGKSPFDSTDALMMKKEIEGQTYITWIYVWDGYLTELFVSEGTELTPQMGSRIARAESLVLQKPEASVLRVTLTCVSRDTRVSRSRNLVLRSEEISP
jgi:prepilin-type N-terminal cleavage/methylation domain-containing protein